MALNRLRCEWVGTGVEGPGLTTFYQDPAGAAGIVVGASGFFSALSARIPAGTTITIPGGGDVIDEVTGSLIGSWGGGTATTITCTGSGAFAGGVGARIVWETDQVRAGRRVRGSTFVVPLTVLSYESNGTLSSSAVGDLETAVSNYMVQASVYGRVWSRPRPGLSGASVEIVRGVAPDRVSWLRSRRT